MNKSTQIRFLRASYWIGAIVDALVMVPMLSPRVASVVLGIPNFNPGSDYRYAIYIAASLMLGWVCLLIWADRKPIERKGVLLLTIFPAITGLVISGVYGVTSNLIPIEKMIPTWTVQAMLALLFGFSYLNAKE
jgi:hypothetical protein